LPLRDQRRATRDQACYDHSGRPPALFKACRRAFTYHQPIFTASCISRRPTVRDPVALPRQLSLLASRAPRLSRRTPHARSPRLFLTMSATAQSEHEDQAARHASTPEIIGDHLHDQQDQAWTLISDHQPESSAPRPASLFSAGRPALPSEGSAEQHHAQDNPTHARHIASSIASSPLQALARFTNMKRSQRMRAHQEPSPIVQFSNQIPSAQKAADDPTTPPDSRSARETRGREYTTLTTLSRLFAGNDTMPSSRTPSYNQATGPLYTRGNILASPPAVLLAKLLQHPRSLYLCLTTSSHAACSKAAIQT
jgi:hypothetical protein